MNAYMYLAMLGNQLLSSIFADYISILSKLRRNTADMQGIWMDYQNKTLFLWHKNDKNMKVSTMREINPKETTRAYAFELWMKAPMPMVTFFKILDVSRLVKISKKSGMKFNMLMCWCIGKAASSIKEFYMLPVGDKLMQYDAIAVNTIVMNKDNEVSSCDVPFSDDLQLFNEDYLKLTTEVARSCENHDLTESMVIGTSALAQYEIDGAVGMYSGIFNNPFMIWGKYHKGFFRTTLTVSFQFHHTQMDGAHAAKFLDCLQQEINKLLV